MQTCLTAAFSKPMSKNVRVATMNKEASWQMLEKAQRAILVFAAHEEEPPAADEEDGETSGPRRPMTRHRGRRRTGRSSGPAHMEWLHTPDVIINEQPLTPAYQLATLLIHKQLNADDWDEAWNGTETMLREQCMTKGVHPVWQAIAERTLLLGQFLAFPKAKASSKKASKSMDTVLFTINPHDGDALSDVLRLASASTSDATTNVAIQKVINQLNSGRTVQPDSHLFNLTDGLCFVSFLLSIHCDQAVEKSVLKACQAKDESLSIALEDVMSLSNGTMNDWEGLLKLEPDNPLSQRRLQLGWSLAPSSAESLTSEQLGQGLEHLEVAGLTTQLERMTWWRLKALHKEGEKAQALELLQGLSLDANSDVSELLPLIASLDDAIADQWLLTLLPEIDEDAWLSMVNHSELNDSVRTAAAQRLVDGEQGTWVDAKSSVVQTLMIAFDIERLCKVFSEDDLLPLSHPYEALFVSHVAPAYLPISLRAKLVTCRDQALKSIHGTEVPPVLSSISEHLLLLLEGINEETPEELLAVLGKTKTALKAYSPIRAALAEGDGVVFATPIRNMQASLEELELSHVERRLFEVILLTLTMNGMLQRYHIGQSDKDDASLADSLLDNLSFPMRLVDSLSFLVLEHDLGLKQFADWFQRVEPRSPIAALARAALYASNGDELNSAREYSRAAGLFASALENNENHPLLQTEEDDDDSAIALPISLYRKSLIHYAHGKQWAEAIDLLAKIPALKSAITERFKLYLKVCHQSQTDTDAASRLIRQFVQRKQTYEEVDEEGEITIRTRTIYLEEELDLLRNYPYEQAHLLPPEPFLGRVTAASTRISKENRRSRNQFEQQFRQAMQSSSPSLDEIYDLAKSAAEHGPFEGLMYLERAQNSPKFKAKERKQLAGVEQTLFSQYKAEISTSKRRFLHNLSLTPLIIVDTNILVDALVEKVYQHMNLVSGSNINFISSNRFHHVLRHHAQSGNLHLMVPEDVHGELKQFAKDNRLGYRFKGAFVNEDRLNQATSETMMLKMVEEVVKEFNTWTPTKAMLDELPTSSETLTDFQLKHSDVFADLTELKQARGPTYRTTQNGRHIYPEQTDLDVYLLATHLASQALPEIGAVLVATMDGDFTLLDRAIEETFGFSVTKNHRTLKSYLNIQGN
ncbi:MAG: hypothetical protein L7S56_02320 [Candidatus Poseidonia sp.]|nr:hypothetical protein [Poseidonia sp.]